MDIAIHSPETWNTLPIFTQFQLFLLLVFFLLLSWFLLVNYSWSHFINFSPLVFFFWFFQFFTLHLSSVLSPFLSVHLFFLLSFSNFLRFLTDVVDSLSDEKFLIIFSLNLSVKCTHFFFLTSFWLFSDFLLTFSWLPSDFFLTSFCTFLFYLIIFFPACQHKWYRWSSVHLHHIPDHFCDKRWGVSDWLSWFQSIRFVELW